MLPDTSRHSFCIQPIDHDKVWLHGNFTERVSVRIFDAVHKWVHDNPQRCHELEAKARVASTYDEVLHEWRTGATESGDGYLSRTVTLQPAGKVRLSDLKKHGHVGRAHFRDDVSLSNMPCDLRGALSEGEYVELRLVRSHLRALVGYAHARGVSCPALQTYAIDYRTIEAKWVEDYKVTPGAAKQLVMTLLNDGTWGTWCKVYDVDTSFRQLPPPALSAIEAERDACYDLIKEDPAVKRVYNSRYQKWNRGDKLRPAPTKRKVALATLMENIERRVLEDILTVVAEDDEAFDTHDLERVRYTRYGFAVPMDVYEKHKLTLESVGDDDNPQHYGMALEVRPFDTTLLQVVTAVSPPPVSVSSSSPPVPVSSSSPPVPVTAPTPPPPHAQTTTPRSTEFRREKTLQSLMVDQWDHTSLGADYDMYGCEFRIQTGRIDLLARKKDGTELLVIELKRSTASRDAVAQVQAYMNNVRKEVAKPHQEVRGMVIAAAKDAGFDAALQESQRGAGEVPTIVFRPYQMQFGV